MVMKRVRVAVLALSLAGCASEFSESMEPPTLTATRSVSFGDEEGEGALSSVWGVAVSGSGGVILSEPQFARVVEFRADGTVYRVVGGRGDGPGEFRLPGAVSWRGDSLAVTDFQRGISLFAPDRSFATMIAFTINDGSSPFGLRPIFALADGLVAAMAPASNSAVTDGATTQEVWLKTSRDGGIVDTLLTLGLEGRLYSVRFQERVRSGAHPVSWAPLFTTPPSMTSLVVVERAPAATAEAATYRVLRIGLDGDTLQVVTVPDEPLPLTAGQVDSIALAMAEGWAQGSDAPAPSVVRAIRDQLDWPAFQPPVTAVLAGDDGSIWVRRETLDAPSALWEILNEDLGQVGRVTLPMEFELKVVARNWVYGVELDEFDVPKVVRFNVDGG